MRKKLLSLFLIGLFMSPIYAEQRSISDAKAMAESFMKENGLDFTITKSSKGNKVRTSVNQELVPYYIFNDTRRGRFVIVAGETGMTDILAYSNDECFNIDDVPPGAQMWLDVYANCAKLAAEDPKGAAAQKASERSVRKAKSYERRNSVNPLLGSINYNQFTPYNNECPQLKYMVNGSMTFEKAASGCTATAMATILRYWKWPKQAKGKKTYTFKYDNNSKSKTLTVDFDSLGRYDWENILPTYRPGTSYNAKEAAAMARLLYHCGVACSANYGIGVTSAGVNVSAFREFFGFASGHKEDKIGNYKDSESYRASVANELSQGRPIWWSGGDGDDPENPSGWHSYVCDGYDMNDLFHFNLGWDGSGNGYYEIAPVPKNPYGYKMWFHVNLHPEGRLTPTTPPRRVVAEAGLGSWNSETSKIRTGFNTLSGTNKFSETIICIATLPESTDANNYLPGMGEVKGVLFDRCDTVTNNTANLLTTSYNKRYKTDAPALMDIDALFCSDSTMEVTVRTEFPDNHSDTDYRLAFVYTEDDVKYNNITYNYISRGIFPNHSGIKGSIPSEIVYETEYKYIDTIPVPSSITDKDKANLIAMMIDNKTGKIVNADKIDLKQISIWRASRTPQLFENGKVVEDEKAINTYSFDETNNRMPFSVKIKNRLPEQLNVEVEVKALELASGATLQIGETADNSCKFTIQPSIVDSTLTFYLNIGDKFTSSKSSAKVTLKYDGKVATTQTVNFDFIKSITGVNAYTVRNKGELSTLISPEKQDTITTLTLNGRLCGNDIKYIRDSLINNLKRLDLSQTEIVSGPGNYYSSYLTEDNIIGSWMFYKTNLGRLVLPKGVTELGTYSIYQNTRLTDIVLNEGLTHINSNVFSGCAALERITLPSTVVELGRNAFKGCPIVCAIALNNTPAKLEANVFDAANLANATLVVPDAIAVEAYKTAVQWKSFGSIITYNDYLTSIKPVEDKKLDVCISKGQIKVASNEPVSIYTLGGQLITIQQTNDNGEVNIELPEGTYIVKSGKKANKVKL